MHEKVAAKITVGCVPARSGRAASGVTLTANGAVAFLRTDFDQSGAVPNTLREGRFAATANHANPTPLFDKLAQWNKAADLPKGAASKVAV